MFKKINKYQIAYSEIIGSDSWLYACNKSVDFYEVQELKDNKQRLTGNEISFFSYPQGHTYTPFNLEEGIYYCCPVIVNDIIYFLKANFVNGVLSIIKYQPTQAILSEIQSFELKDVNLYNIRLAKYPLMLISVSVDQDFVCYYPEKIKFKLDDRDSFIIKIDDIFYFNRWTEEEIDDNLNITADYRYCESIVEMNRNGKILSIEKGALFQMPNGELWVF